MFGESRKKGLPKRYDNYKSLWITCNNFSKTGLNLSQIKVKNTLEKANKILKLCNQRTLTSRKQQLLQVLVNYVYTDKWKSGNAICFVGNKKLADDMGIDERNIRRLLTGLEKEGWILRQYDEKNHRNSKDYGINLLPLGARLEKIAEELEELKRQEKIKQNSRKIISDEFVENKKTSQKLSSGEDKIILHKPYKNNNIENVNNEKKVKSKINLVKKLVEVSPTLENELTLEEKQELKTINIIRTIEMLRYKKLNGLNNLIWKRGLKKHGIYALASAIITIEKPDIKNKPAYLSGILKKDDISTSVWQTIDKMKQEQDKLQNLIEEPTKEIKRQEKNIDCSKPPVEDTNQKTWNEIYQKMIDEIGLVNCESWLKALKILTNKNQITLLAPNKFIYNWINNNYISKITKLFENKNIKIFLRIGNN